MKYSDTGFRHMAHPAGLRTLHWEPHIEIFLTFSFLAVMFHFSSV